MLLSYKKHIISIFAMSVLLILFPKYIFDNYELKSSFAVEDTKTISDKDIQEFNKQGYYNFQTIGDFDKAIEWYDKVLTIDKNNVEALSKKGEVLSNLNNYSDAFELVDKALNIEPNSIIALNAKGYVLYQQNNDSKAIDYYDKALAINPNYTYALTNKGIAFYNQGNISEAMRYLRQGTGNRTKPYSCYI